MNENTIKGQWEQVKGAVKETWGELTDDEITQLEGNRQKLSGKIQERYGRAKDVVEKEIDDWSTVSIRPTPIAISKHEAGAHQYPYLYG